MATVPPDNPPINLTVLQISLREHDERQLYTTRRTLHDLRTMYAVLTDIIHKNITKVFLENYLHHSNPYRTFSSHQIRSPKGNNAASLY